MIDFHHTLNLCWYISSPWGYCIPPCEVNLLERVYIGATRTFGYCCGVKWKQDRWVYAIGYVDAYAAYRTHRNILHLTEHEIIGTGEMQLAAQELPAFVLGERILLRSHNQGTRQRLIMGIQLLNRSWFYFVEWMPPALEEVTTLDDRLAFVPQRDLVRVFH
jgi:Protein of unknown function (DUF1392)